jgi:hypothetical protein
MHAFKKKIQLYGYRILSNRMRIKGSLHTAFWLRGHRWASLRFTLGPKARNPKARWPNYMAHYFGVEFMCFWAKSPILCIFGKITLAINENIYIYIYYF